MVVNSYTREIIVSNTPGAAYRAMTSEFDKWWTAGSTPVTAVGDTVTFRFDPTYWTMRAIKLIPDQTVELECVEAHHIPEGLPETIRKEILTSPNEQALRAAGEETLDKIVSEILLGVDHFRVDEMLVMPQQGHLFNATVSA